MQRLMKHLCLGIALCLATGLWAGEEPVSKPMSEQDIYPCANKYCMSLLNKTRTSKTAGKNQLTVALKTKWQDFDKKYKSDREYHELPGDKHFRKLTNVVTFKYGWHEDHHIGLGIPWIWSDFNYGSKDMDHNGLGNIFIYEKWNLIKETRYIPGIALDAWYYFETGDSDKKLGSSDSAVRFTAELSKAWPGFSLHFNPGYKIDCGSGPDMEELNGGIIFTPNKKFWPVIEYNYIHQDNKGEAHDILPGFI